MVANIDKLMEIYRGITPFLIADFFRIVLLFFVPGISLFAVYFIK